MNLTTLVHLLNYGLVLIFGIIASFYLADYPFPAHKRAYCLTIIGFSLMELIFYLILGEDVLYKCYPLLIHLPLILLIRFVLHRNFFVSVIAVSSAYLLCTPRKMFGTLGAFFFDYDPFIADIVAILVTIPLLWLIIRFLSPYIIRLKYENQTILFLFCLLPMAYYVLKYAFTVYTSLLYTGGFIIADFLDSFIVFLYCILSIYVIDITGKKKKAEQENLLLTAVTIQSRKEISQLSQLQRQSAIYRHDLRHHLHFLESCIMQDKKEDALKYIQEIGVSLSQSTITQYCNNEALNLILSFYADSAKEKQIRFSVSVTASSFSAFQITDLCSLLSNGLENAIHACTLSEDPAKRYMQLKIYEKNGQLCISLVNSCKDSPVFQNGIPLSPNKEQGHGYGVQSMISVVDKYHGNCRFFTTDGEFRFQAAL